MIIPHSDFSGVIETLKGIVQETDQIILDIYKNAFAINKKTDGSPVTDADHAAHQHISKALTTHFPTIPILSEESTHTDYSERKNWQQYWLIDPLDGTKEFIKRNHQFSVNIALMQSNQPVIGMISSPYSKELFWASLGHGSFKSIGSDTQNLTVTQSPSLIRAILGNSQTQPKAFDYIATLQKTHSVNIQHLGSSLKMCRIAEGLADLYPRFGATSEWDTAAAQIILTEAGGQLIKSDGTPLQYNKPTLLNPDFFAFGDIQYASLSKGNQ